MSRPDPIQYAERLYAAIRAANFSPISFLAFGSAVKDGVEFRRMPRIAAEPFMRVVGEMLDLEQETVDTEVIDAVISNEGRLPANERPRQENASAASITSPSTSPPAANNPTEAVNVTPRSENDGGGTND